MKTVGVRELKNRLSEYLRQVRSGQSVLVTDRGEVIAEFSPPGRGLADASVPAGLLGLARRSSRARMALDSLAHRRIAPHRALIP
jgi:antitoxin (DNA-binding transcriptional repressor) of toxin-antitoxin stability system